MFHTYKKDASQVPAASAGKVRWFIDSNTGLLTFVDENGIADTAGTSDWDDVANKPSTFPPSAHTHQIADVIGLQSELTTINENQVAFSAVTSDVNRLSESGVVTGADIVVISNTVFQITAGVFQEVDKLNATVTKTEILSPINISTVNNLPAGPFPNSGSWYVTIKKYNGTWANLSRKFDIGTDLTVEWFPERPIGRGPSSGGVTLKKVFFLNAVTMLVETPRPYSFDGIDHYHEQIVGSGGRGCILSTNIDTNKINVNTFISYRANAYGPGVHAGNSLATTDIYQGIFREDGITRGIPMRGHLFNLLDTSGGSNEYIANAAITPGGIYWQWWKFIDQTRTQTPSSALVPTAAGTNRWVLHWIGMFAGKSSSQNPILIWAENSHSTEDRALAQPIPTLNSRSVDLTILGGCLINTSEATLANARWISGPRFLNVM